MIGIYDCFGYGVGYDVSFEKRYKLIKEAGFDSVMLWWSDKFGRGMGYKEDVQLARNAGLFVENIHTPVHDQNSLSNENQEGESVFQCYLKCVSDCDQNDISTMVIHLPNNQNPLENIGIERLKRIVDLAYAKKVKIAFENLNNLYNLSLVLDMFDTENVGFCYDSCHHINYNSKVDILSQYGNRLLALHLHDNGGEHNQHQLPFDGSIAWEDVMNKIVQTGYKGATTLEPMNWDYTNLNVWQFLNLAYQKAKRLDEMRKK